MKFIYHIRELLSSSQLYLSSLFFSCTVLQLKCMKHALLNSKFKLLLDLSLQTSFIILKFHMKIQITKQKVEEEVLFGNLNFHLEFQKYKRS